MATKKQHEFRTSKEHIEMLKRLAEARIGIPLSEEHKARLKGRTPWNKGLTKHDNVMLNNIAEKNKEYNWMRGKKPWNSGKTVNEYASKEGIIKMHTSATVNLKGKTYEEIYGPEKAKEQKEKRKIKTQQHYDNGTATFGFPKDGTMKLKRRQQIFPKQDTKIEIKIRNFLDELKIEYFQHKYMNINHGYQCDFFIPSLNLVVECDGNYWHKYPTGTDIDHIRTKELLKSGFKVLRLWEFEIHKLDLTMFKNKLDL